MTPHRETIVGMAERMGRGVVPSDIGDELRAAIIDASSTRNLHDRELWDAARLIMAKVRGFNLDPVRAAE